MTEIRVAYIKDGVYSTNLGELSLTELRILEGQIRVEIHKRRTKIFKYV
jgi:hypothetical protein